MNQQKNKNKKRWLAVGAILMSLSLGCAGFWFLGKNIVASDSVYGQQLAEEGEATVEIEGNVELTEDLVVNGDKTLTGDGTLTLNGSITVNSGATLTVEEAVEIDADNEQQGIIVEKGANVVLNGTILKNCTYGIQNKGTVTANGVQITDSVNHGIYNAGTFNGTDIKITNAGDLGVNNAGQMEIEGLTVEGNVSKAFYNGNACSAKLTSASIDGTSGTHDYLVDNNGGTLELVDTTIENAKTTAVYNRNSAKATVSNVILDYMGGHGIFVDSGCTLTGEGLVVNHVNLADNSEGFAIKNLGTVENLNKVTFGDYDTNVTGSGCELDTSTASGVGKTALWLESGNYTGADLVIKNVDENAIYSKGIAEIENLTVDGAANGINCRNNGWVTLSGTNSLSKIDGSAVRTFGAESGSYNNGITLASGASMTVDTVGSHAINNKGSFLAAADSSLTVKNVTGTGINAINNNGGDMTLGDVVIDNVHVTINKDSSGNINTNSGNGIMNNSTIAANGAITISNIYTTPADGLKDNSNGSGVVVKSGGKITGSGSITVIGPETTDSNSTELPLYNGIYVQSSKLSVEGAVSVENIGNQGIYIAEADASIKAKSITVKNVDGNGIYINNTSGVLKAAGSIVVDNAIGNGINNNAGGDITAHNISISNITQYNGIANGTGGTIDVRHDIVVDKVGGTTAGTSQGNGISNSSGTIEVGGDVTVTNITTSGNTDNSSNNGITGKGALYVIGNITVDSVAAGHGMFLNTTGVVHSYGDVTINNVATEGKQGIYLANASGKNVCNFTAVNVTLTDIGGNGIYITKHAGNNFVSTGKLTISSLVKGRAISNQGGVMVVKNVDISDIQGNYHAIENKGTFSVRGTTVNVSGIANGGHGIYNEGIFKTSTNCTMTISDINGAKPNGIHNTATGTLKLGKVVIDGVTVTSADDVSLGNGIYNLGKADAKAFTISNVAGSGIQNEGDLNVSQSAAISDSGRYGLSNDGTFAGKGISIANAADLVVSNTGDMEIDTLTTKGTGTTALYNIGYAEIYKATIDGTSVTGDYLVDNYAGVLDLTDTTIMNARSTALSNRGEAYTSVTNVVIDQAGNYGVYVEQDSELSGNGLEINNVTQGITGAEGVPLKNYGEIFVLDHVTIGADDPEVTGSGATTSSTLANIVGNGIIMDATTATYSGYDLVINNASAGCAVYNKGIMYITDFASDNAKDGMVSRYSGWATLSGNIAVTNSVRNAFTTYGPESNSYSNGIELTSGSTMVIDGAASHGINNKGSFLAAADSSLTVKNIKGTNINGINNNAGTMTLGNVTIDNVLVDVTMYNDTTINSNSGNGIISSGALTIDGAVVISNIYHAPANDKTNNSNGTGIVIKNGGSITGNGSIEVNGTSDTTIDGVAYKGLYNGIFTSKCSIDLAGDITVNNAKNQGIYVADANASLKAGNITISNVSKGHGIYVNNTSGSLESSGSITITDMLGGRGLYNNGTMTVAGDVAITNTANNGIETAGTISVTGNVTISETLTGKRGIYMNGASASMTVGNLTINNAGENAIYINNAAGKLTTAGAITITFPAARGIYNMGIVNAGNIVVTDLTAAQGNYYAIENTGTITASGDVTVERVVNAAGICNKGTFTANGTTTISDVSGTQANGIYQGAGQTMSLNNLVISNVTTTDTEGNSGNGIFNAGTVNVTGTATISSVASNAVYLSNTDNSVNTTINALNVDSCAGTISGTGYAIYAEAAITSSNLSVGALNWSNCLSGAYNSNVDAACITTVTQQ